MKNNKSLFILALAALTFAACTPASKKPHYNIDSVASEQGTEVFQPNWDSIAAHYHFPQWFRDGKFGNIVRIARDRPLSDPKSQEFLDYVKEEFHQFPFCARSCDFPDAEKHVRNLMRHGVLAGFATLIEAGGGMVSQHEYTFYIDGKRGEVTTLP